ncbi:radical SAM/SPASM domain-containing protein [uncultured Brachyspira sp.]|uniref:radical SAM/SPASM domain-containing protein n=1 Tax=uncultured Brachyspira sp. TaxID=221953 RepID=UPI0027DC941C|nr:radical SAM/SPASM domain-containing protein [uncultured Brachyspira sp.]
MKAQIKPKINLEERVKLQDVLPLKTPFSMLIEPSDKCNFRCKFCPTSDLKLMQATEGRNYGNMNFDLYKKVIDDIAEFEDNLKIVHLYNQGEPLLNPYFSNMVEYAKSKKYINKVATTSNAYLLNKELSLRIIQAGLDRIQISIEGINEEQYFNISNVKIDFNKLVNNIKFFYENKKQCEVSIKIPGNNLSDDDKKKFYDIFGNICDLIFIENIVPNWSGFDISGLEIDTGISMYGKQVNKVSVCSLSFYSMAINSNGMVSPCCIDWARKVIIGNAYNKKLKDIWNGEELLNLQKLFLRGERDKHPFCSSCGGPEYAFHDNIDDYAEEILFKIKRRLIAFEYAYKKTA